MRERKKVLTSYMIEISAPCAIAPQGPFSMALMRTQTILVWGPFVKG